MQPGDLLVTALTEDHAVGETFSEPWLLHATVLAWFRLHSSPEEVAHKLEQAYVGVKPFAVHMGGETHLGFGGKALVNLVQQPTPLTELQARTVAVLDALDTNFATGRGTWDGEYRPHVTVQETERLHESDTFWCDRLYLIEQKGKYHEIVGAMHLGL